MRHGRKSRSVLFDGYKRHVLRDLDTGLVPAVGITPANAPEASVTDDITADLDAAGWHLSELHIDRAYLSSALVRDRGPDLAIFCKAWRVRNTGGRFAKDQFTLDFAAGQLTCPAGVSHAVRARQDRPLPQGHLRGLPAAGTVHHQQQRAQRRPSIPTRRCWPSCATASRPRKDARSCANASQVEHALAHVGHWQGRRARYLGTRKNLFDLRRVAVVHNLHVIARQPVTDSYQLAA